MWRDTNRFANNDGSACWNLNEMDGSESMAICVSLRLSFVFVACRAVLSALVRRPPICVNLRKLTFVPEAHSRHFMPGLRRAQSSRYHHLVRPGQTHLRP
jgi:hypothetical protein